MASNRLRAAIRLFTTDVALALLAILAVALLLAPTERFFLKFPQPVAFDEGYTAALAERMIDGRWLPYVDGCSHRGPLLYWASAIFHWFGGRGSFAGMRWLQIALMATTIAGMFGTALALRRPLAGALAALFYAYALLIYDTRAAFGVVGETVSSPFAVLALMFSSFALVRARSVRAMAVLLALSGICAALSGLAKQTSLPVMGPLALWAILRLRNETAFTRRQKIWLFSALGAGFVVPLALVLVRYLAAGELSTFWYWFYRYNAEVYMAPMRDLDWRTAFDMLPERDPWPLFAVSLFVIVALGAELGSLGRGKLWQESGFELTLALLMLLMFIGAVAPFRFFFHYFLPVYPLAALFIGLAIDRKLALAADRPGFAFAAKLTAVAGLVALTAFAADHRERGLINSRNSGGWTELLPDPVCDFVDAHSSPDQPLFIWGFDADLYVKCKRRSASRFLYLTLVAGNVPGPWWSQPNPRGVAEGSRERLLADLEQTRPPVILEILLHMGNVSFRTVPEIAAYIDRNYCMQQPIKTKDGRATTPWLRKQNELCPVASAKQ